MKKYIPIMQKILHVDSSKVMTQQSLAELYKGMPVDVKERALRFRFPKDAYNFVLGRILLQKGLRALGLDDDLSAITYEENGKPVLPNVFFNISHSGHIVVCVLSTQGPIGIDVEVRSDIELDHFVNYFTTEEWKDIQQAVDSIARFYFYWTRKEAVIKALGVNLSWLHEIELDAKGQSFMARGKEWILEDVQLNDLEEDLKNRVFCVTCERTKIILNRYKKGR